jgi:iron complex outermembrane recepter protein
MGNLANPALKPLPSVAILLRIGIMRNRRTLPITYQLQSDYRVASLALRSAPEFSRATNKADFSGELGMKTKAFVFLLSFTALTAPAFAQNTSVADDKPEANSSDAIIVTGSRIKRVALDSALPLQVITIEDLKRDGVSNPEQLIALLNTNGNGADNLASNSDITSGAQRGNNGASSANLRGQGSGATLVLLNGRRVAAHGLNGGAVDINQIPLAAVQRVEILKDGASAIYGTDAIGGVINFILKKDFTGFSVDAFMDVTEQGGGNIYRTSATAGFGDLGTNGFNVMGTIGYSKNLSLRGNQRDFVNTFQPDRGLSVDTRGTPFATILPFAGTIIPNSASAPFIPGSTTVRASGGINPLNLPGGPGCGVVDGQAAYDPAIWDFPEARFACAWDTGRAAILQQPIETINFVVRGVAAISDDHELSLELTGSNADSAKRFSNLQLTPNAASRNYAYRRNDNTAAVYDRVIGQLRAAFPGFNPPAGAPIGYRWRCIECGPREIQTSTKTGRAFLGMNGPLIGGWDYSAGASYAFSESKSKLGSGYYYTNGRDINNQAIPGPLQANIVDVLNSGLINPFLLPGEKQSAAGLAALETASAKGVTLYGGRFSVIQLDYSVSGSLFELPGGTAQAAIGIDYRQERYKFNGDARAAAARPQILAAPFDDGNALAGAKREIKAAYAEVLFPVFDMLEITAAGRVDDYTGFGSTINPKVSFSFKPIDQLKFRGSYNTGFRVPSFNQIFNGVSSSPYSGRDIVDPKTCPTGKPSATVVGCTALEPNTVELINGGKVDLGPEKAKQFSLGVVFEPTRQFSVTLDWWNIKRSDTITLIDLQDLILNAPLFPDRFIRNAAGTLVAIDQRLVNAGESKTSGLELALRGTGDLAGGVWSAGMDGTYLLQKKERLLPNVPFGPSQIGQFTFSGDLGLKWKHTAYLAYTHGPWGVSFSQIFRKGYVNQELPGVADGVVSPPRVEKRVNDYTLYNMTASYELFKGLSITAGVKNIFNTDPPFAVTYDSSTGAGSSWEPRVADPRGRSYTLRIGYEF